MTVWQQERVAADHAAAGRAYHEFLRVPALSAGLYVLPPGELDEQQPHAEDEVYVVVAGRGAVTIDGETSEVAQGSVVFVPARVEHRFHDITEELRLLVVFAPAESD